MAVTNEIECFFGIAKMQHEQWSGDGGPSWSRYPMLEINTTIFFKEYDEDYNHEVVEIGLMKLYKLNKQSDMWDSCDSIDGDSEEVGAAIESVPNLKADPYILSWFEIKEQYRKKGLGHIALHIGLQSSGCEGHPLFLLPSPNEKHSGFEFLTQFYLDADMRSFIVEGSRIVCCPMYNNRDSVMRKMSKRKSRKPKK